MLDRPDSRTWRRWQEIARDRAGRLDSSGEKAQTYLWWGLYGGNRGFYRATRDNRDRWEREESGELVRIRRRVRMREWIETLVRIKTKGGAVVPFTLNQGQRDVLARIYRQVRRGVPVRIVVLKARQVGISTLVQALELHGCLRKNLYSGLLVAHRKETSREILGRVHVMSTRLFNLMEPKKPWRLKLTRRSRDEIAFDLPLESSIRVDSAEVEEPGHGYTVEALHLSETSRWPEAERKAKGLEQIVPELSSTIAIDESTANGDTGYFRNKFARAYWKTGARDAGEDSFAGWVAHFIPWYVDQEYRWTFVRNSKALPADVQKEIEESLTPEEKRLLTCKYLLRGKGWVYVDLDQLAWRRWCKRNKCDDDWSTFNEQYPGFPEDAFLASGRPVFDPEIVLDRLKRTVEPKMVGDVRQVEGGKAREVRFVQSDNGPISIWVPPEEYTDYVLSVDAAEGVRGDKVRGLKDKGGDKSAATMIRLRDGALVARIYGFIVPSDLASMSAKLCWLYNEALLAIEIYPSAFGMGVCKEALNLGYSRLYQRVSLNKVVEEPTEQLGFYTETGTHAVMTDKVRKALRAENFIPSRELLEEIQHLKYDKTASVVTDGYKDLYTAYAIGLIVREQTYARGEVRPEAPRALDDSDRAWLDWERRIGTEPGRKEVTVLYDGCDL